MDHFEEISDDERRFEEYLKQTRPSDSWPRRSYCCGTSRSFYCCECCTICIPEESLPVPIFEGRFRLPFDVDVVLDEKERRTSATGIQLICLVNALASRREQMCLEKSERSTTLYDLEHRPFPNYRSEEDGVYVLYPDKDSVPISSVSPTKLVVLDMKWSRTSARNHPNLKHLRKVHLSSPPAHSRFWRWHNESPGMLSTIEAIFFAAREVTLYDATWSQAERDNLIHLFWLFSLQRYVINEKSQAEQRALPFTEAGKEERRLLRYQTEKTRKRNVDEEQVR
jgi:DTW domain